MVQDSNERKVVESGKPSSSRSPKRGQAAEVRPMRYVLGAPPRSGHHRHGRQLMLI